MPKYKIMIVEDEEIVAADIQTSVENMGYSVCAMASSGMEAIKKAESTRPDLILMDIVLKGSMDGIEAATLIKELCNIPVIYLTAFGDDSIMQQAKIAEPYGYITKPFRYRELQIAIEISIYKKQAETKIKMMEHWLATVLKSIGDAVIASDKDGRITFMNAVAEKLTGWNQKDALGKKITDILNIKDQDLRALEKHLVEKVMTEGLIINLIEDRLLIAKNGTEVRISDSAAPIKGDSGETPGTVLVFRDITEHKQMMEALRKSEERFRLLIEKTEDIIYTVDRKGFLTYVNPTTEKVLSYSNHELEGKSFVQIIAPECIDSVKDRFKRAMKGESIPVYEVDLIRKDGTRLPAEFNVVTIYDSEGKPLGRYGIGRDITARKQAEEALKQSEEKYRNIFDKTVEGIYRTTPAGRFVILNPAFARICGYASPEEMMEQVTDIANQLYANPEDRLRFQRLMASEGEVKDFHVQFKHRTKGPIWISLHSKAIRDEQDNIQYYDGTIEDITDRKLAEEKLKESETKLQAVFDAVGAGILIIDKESQSIVEANQTATEMIGISKESIIGQSCHMVVCPAEKGKCPVKDLGQSVDHSERKLLCADGRQKDILKTVYPITIKGRECYIESFIDITDSKRNEEERKELQERLQRAEKMEALGLLAGGVAHDLNNALGILVGYSELLYDEMDEHDQRKDDVRNIMMGGEQAAAIVQDLLTIARRGVHTKKVVDLNKTITEYLKSPEYLKLISFHPAVRIKTDLDEDLLKVVGSPVHMSKSLMNLVSNAAEAMSSGGDVVIKTESRYLDRPVSGYDKVEEGDYVVLSVSDEGGGISDDNMKRIFEPFYTKKVMGRSGTGLGLSVVWGTVKDHHGYIDVQSRRSQGTTFILYFPVTHEEMEEDKVAPADEYMGRGERILVVDDIKSQRDLAYRILTKLNYHVETVASGEEAIAHLMKDDVDLIILDMIMDPGMDGFETYRQISATKPRQKTIIVSGFAETERVKMTQYLGAGAFVKKPYIRERIGMAVRKELDEK